MEVNKKQYATIIVLYKPDLFCFVLSFQKDQMLSFVHMHTPVYCTSNGIISQMYFFLNAVS